MDEVKLGTRRSFLKKVAGAIAFFTASLQGLSSNAASQGMVIENSDELAGVEPDDFKWLIGALKGFSATIVREHLILFKRYVDAFNDLESKDRRIDLFLANPVYGRWRNHVLNWVELHNKIMFHRLYFSNLTPKDIAVGKRLRDLIEHDFGSFDQWWVKFRATALSVRAWTVLAFDMDRERLVVCGLDSDSEWAVGLIPILCVDMAEHAYVLDYPGDPVSYLNAWKARVDWKRVERKLISLKGE